jgi:hypothetical protein
MVADVVAAELDRAHDRFGRAEPRARVRAYLSGLVAGLERKNGWTLAERAGEAGPTGCSGCCAGWTGMPAGSVMMCGTT